MSVSEERNNLDKVLSASKIKSGVMTFRVVQN
jgi:hypothetical protein